MGILENIPFVVNNSKYVNINFAEIDNFSNCNLEFKTDNSILEYKFKNTKNTLEFLFMFSLLNFCFWNLLESWEFTIKNKTYRRSEAMLKALKLFYSKET